MIVTTTLKRSLAVDQAITNFDISVVANLLATCVGRIVYLWNLETLAVIHKFGRNTGSVHRENIRDCCFNTTGSLLATCSEDARIVVWNVHSKKTEKVIEAHKGIIYQISFSEDGKQIISASDDGRVHIYDWKTAALVHSFMRHPSAVRCFDFDYAHPDRIICGTIDGHTSTWDTSYQLKLDDIRPDRDWAENGAEQNLMGWADPKKHHTGSILSLQISPHSRFLATGASDHTCKLWSITSYAKDYEAVQHELQEADRTWNRMNDYIHLEDSDPGMDAQVKSGDLSAWKIGDAAISQGYHGDLMYTFRHDGPVLSVKFNRSSSMVITGCMDSTCRLWSTRRGDMLFQINVPAPVSSIHVDENDAMYCVCQNRLLFFDIKANAKEEDLPSYWQRRSLERLTEDAIQAEDMRRKGTAAGPDGEKPMSAEDQELVNKIRDEMADGGVQKKITMTELRTLISHGMVAPSFLPTLVSQFESVDASKEVPASQLLRVLASTPFHPRDIFTALSSLHADSLLDMIKRGESIADALIKLGFKPLAAGQDAELGIGGAGSGGAGGAGGGGGGGGGAGDGVFFNFRDFAPRRMRFQSAYDARHTSPRIGHPYPRNPRDIYASGDYWDDDYSDEYDDPFLYEEELRGMTDRRQPRGKVLHFIPSEQMKLLKDFHANREMKPIFLRDLVLDLNPVGGYPNFNTDAETRDTRPMIANRSVPRQGVRFNDMNTYGRMTKSKIQGRRGGIDQSFSFRDLPLHLGAAGSTVGSSSQTMFQPSRYVRARGLNISFQPPRNGGTVGGQRLRGHVYAEPIVIRQKRGQDVRQQFIVGRSVGMRDSNIDEEYDDEEEEEEEEE
ncbi:hypothetical protein HKX48_009091 [Thoreauomyces humboldtii]|nr:hypothetical protein HKX48_009091 [Thoreauomyces humboldtii]